MLSAIVVAAGNSSRFGGKLSKVLAKIGGNPALFYPLNTLNSHPGVDEIIVVANPANAGRIAALARKHKFNKVKKVVLGGKERCDSVFNGLKYVGRNINYVLIHDGARPLISPKTVSSVILAAKRSKAAIAAVPVKATLKKAGKGLLIKKTVARNGIWEAQTPQVFLKEIIVKAYSDKRRAGSTDDAVLAEEMGFKVRLVLGKEANIKITTP